MMAKSTLMGLKILQMPLFRRSQRFLLPVSSERTESRQLRQSQVLNYDIQMHSKGPKMLNKMIKRQGKLLNSKKKRADEQKSSVSLKFTDSDRMKSFNQVVKENLGWVLIGHKYQSEVLGRGFVVTRVRVDPSFGKMYIFYVTTSGEGKENKEQLSNFLNTHSNDIRVEMEQFSQLGRIPTLAFVYADNDTMPLPTPEDIKGIVDAQKANAAKVETVGGGADCSSDADFEEKTALEYNHLRYLKPRTDTLRFDRSHVLEKIMNEIKLSSPAHRGT